MSAHVASPARSASARTIRRISGLLAAGIILILTACSRESPAGADSNRYDLRGEVLAVDREKNVLRVNHEEIPGLMPAMVMEFEVSAGDASIATTGGRIRADLVDLGQGNFRLERIWPDDTISRTAIDQAAKTLRQDTAIRGRQVYREVGEASPEFTLYDQDGKPFTSARLRGRQFLVNFIYTRCPIATMCPLATQNMVAAQQLSSEAGIDNVHFVSISLDPEYDTPGVLREYADLRGIDTSNFSFLTGPTAAVEDLLAQFGVLSNGGTEGLLAHTLATLLIDADGRIVHRVDGSQWNPQDFVARLRR